MTPDELAVLCANYRSVYKQLRQHVREQFPYATTVHVNCVGRYVGPGLSSGSGFSADHLSVKCPNGNIWDYPLECITQAP